MSELFTYLQYLSLQWLDNSALCGDVPLCEFINPRSLAGHFLQELMIYLFSLFASPKVSLGPLALTRTASKQLV